MDIYKELKEAINIHRGKGEQGRGTGAIYAVSLRIGRVFLWAGSDMLHAGILGTKIEATKVFK